MIKLMYIANGIGVAANQVGYNRRMFVMDTSNERDKPQVFINPVIKAKNNLKMKDVEGCLSCPGEEVTMSRSLSVNLEWFDKEGWIHRFTPQLTSTHGKLKLKGIAGRDDLRERMYSAGKWFYRFVYIDILGVENMWKNMVLFDSYCKANNITFIPLLADHFHEVIRRPEKFYHERVGHTGWWKPLYQGLPITRLHEHIIGHKEDGIGDHVYGDYHAEGNHPNALGHKKIAEKLIELIEAI